MKTIIANITSYIGISVDAVHYYCRYREVSQLELCELMHGSYDNVSSLSIKGDDLLRKISLEDALKLTSSPMEALDISKNGTIRFDTVHQITEELRKQFPDHNLVIAENDSIMDYVSSMLHEEYYQLFDSLTKKQQEKLIYHFSGNDFDRYNEYYKRLEFMCFIFGHKLEDEFVKTVKSILDEVSET